MSQLIKDNGLDQSPEGRLLIKLAEATDALNLPGIEAIAVGKTSYMPDLASPAVVFQPSEEELPDLGGMGEYVVAYRVLCFQVFREPTDPSKGLGQQLLYRNRLLRHFVHDAPQVSTGLECFTLSVQPGGRWPIQAHLRGYDVQFFLITAELRDRS